jgi:hypothetical protein
MALGIRWLLDAPLQGLVGQADKNKLRFSSGWNRLPLAQQWLDKHGVEPIKRRFEAFQQENPTAANIKSVGQGSTIAAISGLGRAGSV